MTSSPKPSERFPCTFCKKVFTTEKRSIIHLCEPKRRALQRGERHVTIAYHAFRRFWETRMDPRNIPLWDKFEKSTLYGAFVRFGKHVYNSNAINPSGFVDYLLRCELGIDDWCKQSHYQAYVRELNKIETPLDALTRNMMLMEQWAMQNREDWTDFFRKVAPAQAVLWITNGRISPWILFTASSAGDLMARLSEEQVELVSSVIDEDFWTVKMERHKAAVVEIVKELAANNV